MNIYNRHDASPFLHGIRRKVESFEISQKKLKIIFFFLIFLFLLVSPLFLQWNLMIQKKTLNRLVAQVRGVRWIPQRARILMA